MTGGSTTRLEWDGVEVLIHDMGACSHGSNPSPCSNIVDPLGNAGRISEKYSYCQRTRSINTSILVFDFLPSNYFYVTWMSSVLPNVVYAKGGPYICSTTQSHRATAPDHEVGTQTMP
jgi:hypothetical protein